jgi:hypothetical protein
MTGRDILAWRGCVTVGDRIAYHRGHLANDRKIDGTAPDSRAAELSGLADAAWSLYLHGRVRLVQRHEDHLVFTYFAVASDDEPNVDYTLTAADNAVSSPLSSPPTIA